MVDHNMGNPDTIVTDKPKYKPLFDINGWIDDKFSHALLFNGPAKYICVSECDA